MQCRHKNFTFPIAGGVLKVDSDFDSGNLQQATICGNKLTITPSFDPMNSQYSTKQSSKTFFHFRVVTNTATTLTLVIRNMKILEYFVNDEQFDELYRVCFGRREKKSMPAPQMYVKDKPSNMKRIESEGTYQLHFDLTLEADQQIFLAYHYPYSFEKSQAYLHHIQQKIKDMNQKGSNIYYRNQLLIESIQSRAINLLTLTQNTPNSQLQPQPRITKSLFPYYELEGRAMKFNKPYVMLTCRVHPGQTSSSYALEGMINFLLSDDSRAKMLMKYCVFVIVPLVNPDGVFHGTYRMDTLGHNLNRFYNTAQSHKQPAIFAIQTIATCYASRIIFFMDLHSHPHPYKGSFIYGNCHSQIQEQTQSQLFAKLLSLQSECFGYNWCNFSTSQMNSRDANELLTKDGSARVQMYKLLNHPLVFTMEMGYHGCSIKPKHQDDRQHIFYGQYRRTQKIFTTQDYQKHGESILITLLRMLELNSGSGLKTEGNKLLQQIRQEVCRQLVEKEERFRQMDSFVFKKVKGISNIIQEVYYEPLFKKYPFALTTDIKDIKALENGMNKTPTCPSNPSKAKFPVQRRQLSLNIRQASQTIEATPERDCHIRSYKSTLEPKQQTSALIEDLKFRQEQFKFAKQLNLNFNPFPITQRKKIYNLVGNNRSTLKKYVLNDLQLTNNQQFQTHSTITPDFRLQRVEHQYFSEEKDLIRNCKLNNFSNRKLLNEEEDSNEDIVEPPHTRQEYLILPRIPSKSRQKPFKVEVELQQQYQKKYNIQQRNLSGVNIKPTLRANAIRMRNLIKSMK